MDDDDYLQKKRIQSDLSRIHHIKERWFSIGFFVGGIFNATVWGVAYWFGV